MPTWYDSTVIKIAEESPTTRKFWVQIDGLDCFDFRPGQFVTMDLPIGEKRRDRWRSYSIANWPDGTNVLEFCIVYLEGGKGTTWFFEEVEIGTKIRFKGPAGTFVLPEKIEHELVMVCTGTGVAPFRSMLGQIVQRGMAHRGLHLIFGTRHESGILYRQEFEQLLEKLPGFRFDVALSRAEELPAAPFPLHRGYVHPIYQNLYATPRPERHFYLCGWTEMVDQAREQLQAMGYERSQVKFELYG